MGFVTAIKVLVAICLTINGIVLIAFIVGGIRAIRQVNEAIRPITTFVD